jgi:hypothetical protein
MQYLMRLLVIVRELVLLVYTCVEKNRVYVFDGMVL